MKAKLEARLRSYPRPFITDSELAILLPGTADSRYGKVKRLIAENKLCVIRRGLYVITEEVGYPRQAHLFQLAQFVYAPSYISLESALSYHGLIPEAVFTTTSVTTRRNKEFTSELGVFSFQRLPHDNFYTDVEIIQEGEYKFMMACPWKAICDYVYCTRQEWLSLSELEESLRLDTNALPALTAETIDRLSHFYQRQRVNKFLHSLQKELLI